MSTTQETGRPGRYQRSAVGLVVALVTTVVAIALVMWFMGLFRHDTDIRPDRVDYLAAVRAAQQGHLEPVYPTALPDGYYATRAEVPDDNDGFEIDLLHGDKDFIGIRVADRASTIALVHDQVDPDPSATSSYDVGAGVTDPLARTWLGFEDSGGNNTGYVAQIGKENVLVYGSAPVADLQQVIDVLTQAQLPAKK